MSWKWLWVRVLLDKEIWLTTKKGFFLSEPKKAKIGADRGF